MKRKLYLILLAVITLSISAVEKQIYAAEDISEPSFVSVGGISKTYANWGQLTFLETSPYKYLEYDIDAFSFSKSLTLGAKTAIINASCKNNRGFLEAEFS